MVDPTHEETVDAEIVDETANGASANGGDPAEGTTVYLLQRQHESGLWEDLGEHPARGSQHAIEAASVVPGEDDAEERIEHGVYRALARRYMRTQRVGERQVTEPTFEDV